MKLAMPLSMLLFLACLPGCGSDTTNANDPGAGSPDAAVATDDGAADPGTTGEDAAINPEDAIVTPGDAIDTPDSPVPTDSAVAPDTTTVPETAEDATVPLDEGSTDPAGSDATLTGLEIAGTWTDEWGGDHLITDTTWTMTGMVAGVFAISQYDNDLDFLIAHNDASNPYSPGLWSRIDWTTWQGALYFCQIAYDKATESEALATEPADRIDPTSTGCGGPFPWSKLAQKE